MCRTLFPSPSSSGRGGGGNRKSVSEGAKESRVQVNCGCPSISTSQYLLEHAQRHGGGGPGLRVGQTLPGGPARCRGPGGGLASSRGGSWDSLGVAGVCAWGCDAWEVCRSGWACGCHGECHRGSGRSRWPFRWAPAGHSLLALQRSGSKRKETSGEER